MKTKFMKKEDGFEFSNSGSNEAIAMPVVDNIMVNGFPVKDKVAEEITKLLQAAVVRDLPPSLESDRVAEALEALVYIRVLQIRHKYVRGYEDLHYRQIEYPALMWPVIRSIGDIVDPTDGIELKVQVGKNLERFADSSYDWDLVSETLKELRNYGMPKGLEIAFAMPKGKDGTLTVLTFLVSERSNLTSHTTHKTPADCMIRASLDLQFADYVWGAPRWEYSSLSYYQNQLVQAVQDTFRG